MTMWNGESYYRHSQNSEKALADSGWHCSFCFRTIAEYKLKMEGFSHSDRLNGKLGLLDPKRIQEVICKGKVGDSRQCLTVLWTHYSFAGHLWHAS